MPEKRYVIPKGTEVEVHNQELGYKTHPHVTRKQLVFSEYLRKGWNNQILYFQYNDWMISVNVSKVQ